MTAVRRIVVLLATLALVLACNDGSSPTSPLDSTQLPHGTLEGVVTIGPNCPGPASDTNPCPTPPSAYADRKVLVFDVGRTKVIATIDIDAHGFYRIDLVPGKYVVDIKGSGIDRSSNVPATVTIQQNVVTKLDIAIDTGIR